MVETCQHCGLPTWKRSGGMGGDIPPDYETYCDKPNGMWCRGRRASYLAGREDALRSMAIAMKWSQLEQGCSAGSVADAWYEWFRMKAEEALEASRGQEDSDAD